LQGNDEKKNVTLSKKNVTLSLTGGLNYKVKDSRFRENDGRKGMTVRHPQQKERHPQLDWGSQLQSERFPLSRE
jgi:hypothetical protein